MEANRQTILVVEDDRVTRRFLADNLDADGYEILEAGSWREAGRLVATRYPDLVLLDLGLPDGDGLGLLAELRDPEQLAGPVDPQLPVVVLSGRGAELDRLRGFDRGCDDYLVKPFSYAELRARIQAVLRRGGCRPGHGRIRVGALEIDSVGRGVWLEGEPVRLAKKEFALLRALASEPTRVFTRDELLRDVWGFRSVCPTRTVDAHAYRLRSKLRRCGGAYVINVWGVGYRLIDGGVEG